MEHSLWANLPLLIRANSKESVENILETLWKTRKVGLETADRDVIRDTLQLQNDSDLDPVNLPIFYFISLFAVVLGLTFFYLLLQLM